MKVTPPVIREKGEKGRGRKGEREVGEQDERRVGHSGARLGRGLVATENGGAGNGGGA